MKKLLKVFLLLVYFFIGKSYATEQIPDKLIYNKDTISIYSNPLEQKESLLIKDKTFWKLSCRSTACWRRYQATWELRNGQLYLIKITSCCNPKLVADLNLIFKGEVNNQGIFAEWFTGRVIVPIGDKIYGEYIGYSNVHLYEDILEIKNGVKDKITRVDNTKTRITYLKSDKLTIELIRKLNKKILDEIWKKEFKLNFYIGVEADENRQVTSVIFDYKKEIHYEKEIQEIILQINDWDILYRHGEKTNLPWLYPVMIDKKKLREYKKHWR